MGTEQDTVEKPQQAKIEQHVVLLTAFIHDLIRDYLPVGKVEHILKDMDDHLWVIHRGDTLSRTVKVIDYENAHLEALSMNLAKRILGEEYWNGHTGRL
jgi:hypothetical protein